MHSKRNHYENVPIQIYWKVSDKIDIFHISAKNIDSGYSLEPPRRGGSNEYPLSMFLAEKKKNNVYPCKPKFYCIKVGYKGVEIVYCCICFRDDDMLTNRNCSTQVGRTHEHFLTIYPKFESATEF